jgi:serine/threonine-protein kinase
MVAGGVGPVEGRDRMSGLTPGIDDLSLGELLVRQGFVTFNQVHECLQIQKRRTRDGAPARLGEILLEHGYLASGQLEQILDLQKRGRSAGKLFIPGYEILDRIGNGAMGAVHRARQVSVDRIVAIKLLSVDLSNDPVFVERFLREARAVAKLSHPNIVAGIDAGELGGLHYYVMEYIEGETAQDLLRRKGRLSEAECVRIGVAIARALDHASHAGIIHRDVKPQNIMAAADNTYKLCDLGLAKNLSSADPSLTAEGIAMGTPYYLSPELARGEHSIDVRSDIYSLGATLYHLSTGMPVFRAATYAAILAKHIEEPAPSPRLSNPELSEGFARIVLKCLAKRKDDRYLTASDLAGDLQALQHPGSSPPTPRVGLRRPSAVVRPATQQGHPHTHSRVMLMPRPRKSPVGLLVALLLLTAALLAVVASVGHSPSSPRIERPDEPLPDDDPAPRTSGVDPFEKRAEEYRAIRDRAPVPRVYELLLKNLIAFGATEHRAYWQKEIEGFEREVNDRIRRLHWAPLLDRVERLKSQGKLVAAVDAVRNFPDEHRYFLRKDKEERLTSAGAEAKVQAEKLFAQIEELSSPLRAEFDRALAADDHAAALAQTDGLAPLAYDAARKEAVEKGRSAVLADLVNDALHLPVTPSRVSSARERIAELFERYRTDPGISSRIESEIARLEEGYLRELDRSSRAMEEGYRSLFEAEFDEGLSQRRFADARRAALRLLKDPFMQTALLMPMIELDYIERRLRAPRWRAAEYLEFVERMEQYRARALTRDEFKPLARFVTDLWALALLEWVVERAALTLSAESPDLKGLRHAGLSNPKLHRIEKIGAEGALVYRLCFSPSGVSELSLAPVDDRCIDPSDLVLLGRRCADFGEDHYLEIQSALLFLYCRPSREKEMRECLERFPAGWYRAGWAQFEPRLATPK